MSRASAEQLAAAQRAQAARAASMQARRNASSSRPVSRGHSARPPFARQIAPKSGGLYNILYHGDGDCATYVGTFLDALSLTRLESTGRIFQKGGMDSIIQRAAFAQLHKAKYYFALKAAAGSYEPYEKAYKFVTERKLANKKRREERAKAMKAREAALARRAAHANANANANANAKAKANAGGDNAGKRVVQNTSTAVPSAKTPAALPAGNVSSGDTVSNDASSGAAKAVKKAKTEASGITPAGTCAKRQLSADMLELATEVGNGNDESKKTGDGNVGSNPSSSDNSTDSSSSSSSAVDPSSPPQIGLDSAYGKRILIRLWTDVVSFTRKCRRSMVLRICELLLNPASYITGGYNKKKLKTQDTCFKYDAYKIPEPAFVRLKARLNCPRREASSVICDGIVYSIGGVYGLQALRTVEKYSFAQERWVAVTPMPKQRRGGASCSINGKIYIAGGYEDGVGSLINVYEYDPHFRGSASMANSSQFPLLQVSLIQIQAHYRLQITSTEFCLMFFLILLLPFYVLLFGIVGKCCILTEISLHIQK